VNYIFILFGGGLGAVARYSVSRWVLSMTTPTFPMGTLAVNLVGALAIGFLTGLFERLAVSQQFRLFLFVGFLGGFTTFSSLALESFNLLKGSEFALALLNLIGSNAAGLALAAGGYYLAGSALRLIRSLA